MGSRAFSEVSSFIPGGGGLLRRLFSNCLLLWWRLSLRSSGSGQARYLWRTRLVAPQHVDLPGSGIEPAIPALALLQWQASSLPPSHRGRPEIVHWQAESQSWPTVGNSPDTEVSAVTLKSGWRPEPTGNQPSSSHRPTQSHVGLRCAGPPGATPEQGVCPIVL